MTIQQPCSERVGNQNVILKEQSDEVGLCLFPEAIPVDELERSSLVVQFFLVLFEWEGFLFLDRSA